MQTLETFATTTREDEDKLKQITRQIEGHTTQLQDMCLTMAISWRIRYKKAVASANVTATKCLQALDPTSQPSLKP